MVMKIIMVDVVVMITSITTLTTTTTIIALSLKISKVVNHFSIIISNLYFVLALTLSVFIWSFRPIFLSISL